MERIPQEEKCPKCGEIKSIREFFLFTKKKTKGGATVRERKLHCTACRKRAYDRIWRREHKNRVKHNNREYWKHKSAYNPNRIQKKET